MLSLLAVNEQAIVELTSPTTIIKSGFSFKRTFSNSRTGEKSIARENVALSA